jgi:hypothetical protein
MGELESVSGKRLIVELLAVIVFLVGIANIEADRGDTTTAAITTDKGKAHG